MSGDVKLPAEVLRLRDAAARRLVDVKNVQLPRLCECTHAAQELMALETELNDTLHTVTSLVQQISDEVDDAESAAERTALQELARAQQAQLASVRQDARRALLQAHRAMVARQESAARTSLLAASSRHVGASTAPTDRASATSERVTSTLQRTVALMSSELEKSGYSAQLLEESSETISQVSTKYASFNDLLSDSISMIRQMERAELVDLGILAASIVFFAGCVMYILYARIFSRGLSAISLVWRTSSYVGSGALGGLSSFSAAVSSVAKVPQNRPKPEARGMSASDVREGDPLEDALRYAETAAPQEHAEMPGMDAWQVDHGRERRKESTKEESSSPSDSRDTQSSGVSFESGPETSRPDTAMHVLDSPALTSMSSASIPAASSDLDFFGFYESAHLSSSAQSDGAEHGTSAHEDISSMTANPVSLKDTSDWTDAISLAGMVNSKHTSDLNDPADLTDPTDLKHATDSMDVSEPTRSATWDPIMSSSVLGSYLHVPTSDSASYSMLFDPKATASPDRGTYQAEAIAGAVSSGYEDTEHIKGIASLASEEQHSPANLPAEKEPGSKLETASPSPTLSPTTSPASTPTKNIGLIDPIHGSPGMRNAVPTLKAERESQEASDSGTHATDVEAGAETNAEADAEADSTMKPVDAVAAKALSAESIEPAEPSEREPPHHASPSSAISLTNGSTPSLVPNASVLSQDLLPVPWLYNSLYAAENASLTMSHLDASSTPTPKPHASRATLTNSRSMSSASLAEHASLPEISASSLQVTPVEPHGPTDSPNQMEEEAPRGSPGVAETISALVDSPVASLSMSSPVSGLSTLHPSSMEAASSPTTSIELAVPVHTWGPVSTRETDAEASEMGLNTSQRAPGETKSKHTNLEAATIPGPVGSSDPKVEHERSVLSNTNSPSAFEPSLLSTISSTDVPALMQHIESPIEEHVPRAVPSVSMSSSIGASWPSTSVTIASASTDVIPTAPLAAMHVDAPSDPAAAAAAPDQDEAALGTSTTTTSSTTTTTKTPPSRRRKPWTDEL